MSKIILSYCNQPIFKVADKYYTAHANFIDFLCCWTAKNQRSRVMVPVSIAQNIESCWVELNLNSEQVIQASSYNSHLGAIFCGFFNALSFRRHVATLNKQYSKEFDIVIPGPNAFGATFSFIAGREIASRVFAVVRGNSLQTVSHMYKKRIFGSFVVFMSRFFFWRLTIFQKRGATALCFGDDLTKIHSDYGRCLSISPLISSFNSTSDLIKNRKKPNKPLTMLFIGRLSREKGLIELFDALEKLVDSGYVFNMLIAGHGPLQAEIETRSASTKLKPYIRFLGRLSPGKEVFDLIDRSDIFLLPSKTEGVPRVIVESISRGVPVITTAVGGIPAAFGDSVTYFKSHHPDDIVDRLAEFLDAPSLLDEFDYQGNSTLKQFTFEDNIKRIENLTSAKAD